MGHVFSFCHRYDMNMQLMIMIFVRLVCDSLRTVSSVNKITDFMVIVAVVECFH